LLFNKHGQFGPSYPEKRRNEMKKFKWIWIFQGILSFIGAMLMTSPLRSPVSDLTLTILIVGGFIIFMLGMTLELFVQKVKHIWGKP
jgi:hypothetical protein